MAHTASSGYLLMALLFAVALTAPLVAITGRQTEGGRIVGRIVDRDSGLPLAAELGIVIRDQSGITMKHVRSSGQGEFEINGLPEGKVLLTTKLAGYAVEHESVAVHSGETGQVEFRLLKAKTVSGVILDSVGQVIEGAQVRVIYADEDAARDAVAATYQWETGEVSSDERGSFMIEVHPAKEFVIEASHRGYVGDVSEPKRVDSDEGSISMRLSLRTGVSVTGEARDVNGQLISGAHISLIELEERPELRRFTSAERLRQSAMQTASGPDGKFRFDQVRPARKSLIITHPRYSPLKQTLDVTDERDSQPTRVTLSSKIVR